MTKCILSCAVFNVLHHSFLVGMLRYLRSYHIHMLDHIFEVMTTAMDFVNQIC